MVCMVFMTVWSISSNPSYISRFLKVLLKCTMTCTTQLGWLACSLKTSLHVSRSFSASNMASYSV